MIKNIYTLLILLTMVCTGLQAQMTINIKDGDLVGGTTYNWTANNTYVIDGYVYLEEGGVLNIEPGTVIKAKTVSTVGDATSALIIARGAQIFAEGTADNPIIFTAELDNLDITNDFTATDNKLWGGLIILGRATVGEDAPAGGTFGEDAIEGITSENEPRILYGGTDDDDNSGVLRYISVRHGGNEIAADNEINGITLGGVGRGTMIDYVEVFANSDDGIEIFGGTVNIKHAVVAFCGDDAIDVDESWDGYIQYAFTIQQDLDSEIGDNAVEYDGSERADLGPKTVGRIYNGTFLGSGAAGASNGLRLKSDGAAQFWNCIWTEMQGYIFRLQNTSITRYNAGETVFANNIAFSYGQYEVDDNNEYEITTEEVDPQLAGISRLPNGMLDPRPNAGSPALSNAASPTETGVDVTSYRGAFSNAENWADGWTAMAEYGYFGNLVTTSTVDLGSNEEGVSLSTPFPNPVIENEAVFSFELPTSSSVGFQVFDIQGRLVSQENVGFQAEGENQFRLNVANYHNGMYIIAMQTEMGTVTQKFTVAK